MRDIKNNLTSGKNSSNIQNRRSKSFGYQVLGFGAGGGGASFICATGGTITTSGNCKIHTFTGDATFTVNAVASCVDQNVVSYLVIAGGGGSVNDRGGAGGAGGFREYKGPAQSYTASPLDGSPGGAGSGTAITITAQGYPIVIGAGGAAQNSPPFSVLANPGVPSSFSTITSTAGGAGGGHPGTNGGPGGSGGGSGKGGSGGGSGNTPPVTPSQGFAGGHYDRCAPSPLSGSGGGGATAVGKNGDGPTNPGAGGPGGAGAGTLINPATGEPGPGPSRYYSGGGGGAQCTAAKGLGGIGGGGNGASGPYPGSSVAAEDGTANTGGGAGASNGGGTSVCGKTGGSGIVIIRYKFQ